MKNPRVHTSVHDGFLIEDQIYQGDGGEQNPPEEARRPARGARLPPSDFLSDSSPSLSLATHLSRPLASPRLAFPPSSACNRPAFSSQSLPQSLQHPFPPFFLFFTTLPSTPPPLHPQRRSVLAVQFQSPPNCFSSLPRSRFVYILFRTSKLDAASWDHLPLSLSVSVCVSALAPSSFAMPPLLSHYLHAVRENIEEAHPDITSHGPRLNYLKV